MLVLEFSWTDWLLQLISPGRYGRGRREGTGDGGEPNEKKDGGDGERGRKETREKGRNKQSAHSRKATNFVILFFKALRCTRPPPPPPPAPSRPRARRGLAVGWMGVTLGSGFWEGSPGPGAGDKGLLLSPREHLQGAGAALPTRPGSAWGQEESHWMWGHWGPYAHVVTVSVPGIWRPGRFPIKEVREGRRSTPQKHLMRRKCLDLALG